MRGVWLVAILLMLNPPMHAGGPAFVAGATYFDPTRSRLMPTSINMSGICEGTFCGLFRFF